MEQDLCIRVDRDALKVIESFLAVNGLDAVLEVFSSHILQMQNVQSVTLFLLNQQDNLVPVCEARNIELCGKLERQVVVQSWALESPVRHTVRRPPMPWTGSAFSIPLFGSGEMIGLLHIRLNRLLIAERDRMGQFYLIALQLASKIREMMLVKEVQQLNGETQELMLYNRQIIEKSTALSKELYTISAVSTKINQSLGCGTSLRKSMAKMREVFKASSVVVYTTNPNGSKMGLSVMEEEGESSNPVILRKIGKLVSKEIIVSAKPLVVLDRKSALKDDKILGVNEFKAIVAVPLKAQNKIIGTMVLLRRDEELLNQDSLRLLSGVANIIGMAIENRNLYLQSEQKEKEAIFLAKSIEKFNEKLDLEETLKSVARKGVEFIGKRCLIHLSIEKKIALVEAVRNQRGGKASIKCQSRREIGPKELEQFIGETADRRRSLLVKNLRQSKRIPRDVKSILLSWGVQSGTMRNLV